VKPERGRRKAQAAISLDLDNEWSYMKIHGDPGWDNYPSYLGLVVPLALSVFRELNIRVTAFVVGKDAEHESNRDALQMIVADGHEIGNHSYNHDSWMHIYSDEQLVEDFQVAEASIERAVGVRPTGFRGPGFCLSDGILRVLVQRGYVYDASTFPTFIGPLARAFYFMKSTLQPGEREQRKNLFGSIRDGFRPLKPYYLGNSDWRILEVPVTTFPVLRSPFHLSYVIYLASYSPLLARIYWKAALHACSLTGVKPSILLHPLDFLGCDKVNSLSFFPGMNLPTAMKIEIVRNCLSDLQQTYDLVPIGEFAITVKGEGGLDVVVPRFYHKS
jgi:peptidoglycan-N-acetylglucosamine deacetylase